MSETIEDKPVRPRISIRGADPYPDPEDGYRYTEYGTVYQKYASEDGLREALTKVIETIKPHTGEHELFDLFYRGTILGRRVVISFSASPELLSEKCGVELVERALLVEAAAMIGEWHGRND